jgi:hypothetical protein
MQWPAMKPEPPLTRTIWGVIVTGAYADVPVFAPNGRPLFVSDMASLERDVLVQ